MSTCSACGGTRQNNILRHAPTCDFYAKSRQAVVEAARNDERRAERERLDAIAKTDMIRLHPDLAELEVQLDSLYPR